jgi:hypothetical protein
MTTTTLLLALLLSPVQPPEQQAVVTTYVMAERAGVSPSMAVCILLRESGGHTWAVGDGGKAVGLWQWHLASWEHVQRARGEPLDDRRAELQASTEAAVWALGHGYKHWWSTLRLCACQ